MIRISGNFGFVAIGKSADEIKNRGIIINVIADDQKLAHTICAFARGRIFFNDYPNKTTTAGNVAVLFSPGDVDLGPVYNWNIWHALKLDNPCEPFQFKIIDFPRI